MKLSACAAFALLLTTPVLADPPGDLSRNIQMSNEKGADSVIGDRETRDTQRLGTCVQLMERAFYLDDPISPDRAYDARHELELARNAFQTGDESDCTRHATHALDDRS